MSWRVRNTLVGMPGSEGTASCRARRRQPILLAGLGLAMAACGTPPSASPAPTYVPTAVVRSALPDAPWGVGQAAPGAATGPVADDGTLAVGTAANDTIGGSI